MKKNIRLVFIILFVITVVSDYLYASDPILKWDTSTGEVTGYTIHYGISQGNYPNSIDVGDVTQYSLNNFSLNEGTTYYFIIRAYNTAGESGDSNITTYTLPDSGDTTPPLPPQNVVAVVDNGSIKLSWSANSEPDLSEYRVYYGTSSRDYGPPITEQTIQYVFSGLDIDVVYYFAITSVDANGNESGLSSPEVSMLIPDTTEPAAEHQIDIRINNGNDDVEEHINTGMVVSNSSDLELVNDPGYGQQLIGLRFRGVNIPQGAEIQKAYIEFETDETKIESTSLEITAESVDNALEFSTNSYNLSERTTLNSRVIWNNVEEWNVISEKHQTPNINNIVQEIISRTGWESGNAIAFIITGNGVRTAESFDGENAAAPLLHIEYSISSGSDITAPVVTITAPTTGTIYGIQSDSINLSGTASDETGISSVTWSNSRSGSGTATGTDNWSAAGIPLSEGDNVITITAKDEAGNAVTDILTVTYTKPDITAPVVTITSPTTATTYGVEISKVNISGTASDAEGIVQVSWSNSRGGSGTASGTDNWSAAGIDLGEGENLITITATDEAGNVSTDTLTITYTVPDTTAPVVTITAPTTGTIYGIQSDSINLSGTASDAIGISSVTWSNSRSGSGTATGTDNWSAAGIPLSEGDNVITITAKDEAGNAVTDILTVTYTKPDITVPVVTITSPTSATTYGVETSKVNISGTASDAEGIAQVSWSNSRGGSGTASGTDNWSAAGIDLGEGENLITITARDEAGNASTDTLTITYIIPDTTAPVVTITAPTTGTSYGTQSDSINLSGTASDAIGISSVTWSNSRSGSGTATGTDNWSAAGIPLSEGDNVITITAKDEAGNAVTDILTVTYTKPDTTAPVVTDTQPPVLELINPSTRKFFFTRKATIILSGTASDNIGVKEVKWINAQGGNGVANGTVNWEAVDVPLARWWNNITITAEDEAGNKTAYNLTVFLWK